MFESAIDKIKDNKRRREAGELIAIPFPFARFANSVPGTEKGRYIIDTASSKVGKTKITDFIFVYNVLNYIKSHGIKARVKYFSLEMSRLDKEMEFIAHQLYKDYGFILSPDQLSSLYSDYITQDALIRIIEEKIKPKLDEFSPYLEYIDNTRNPYGIYNEVRTYAEHNGRYYDKNNKEIPLRDIKNTDRSIKDAANKAIHHYTANDPDEYVIVITDHISLLTPEAEDKGDIRSAMGRFSTRYCLSMRDRWNYTVVNVQQQAAAQEGVENVKASMVRPSANGLGDNKLTGRDCDMLLGLFSPARLQLKTWEGYNIGINNKAVSELKKVHPFPLLNNYREFGVAFSRRGDSGIYSNLFFNGAVNDFRELPKADDPIGLNKVIQLANECDLARNKPKEHVKKTLDKIERFKNLN